MAPVSPFAVASEQSNAVPAQWQTFEQGPCQAVQAPTWEQQQGQAHPQQQQATAPEQHQQPWGQGQTYGGGGWNSSPLMQPQWQPQSQQHNESVPAGTIHTDAVWQAECQAEEGRGAQHAQHPSQWPGHSQQQPPWQGQDQEQPVWQNCQGQRQQQQQQQQHGQLQEAPEQGGAAQQLQEQLLDATPWFRMQAQDSGVQAPGRLQGAPSGVPLEQRARTMRTMSFRQVVRSASEGDAMALQAEPANALQVKMPCCHLCIHTHIRPFGSLIVVDWQGLALLIQQQLTC